MPVVSLDRESLCPGGAANVARNVVALGGKVLPVGVRGDDREGEDLARVCRESGIPVEGMVEAPGRPTTLKMRVVAQGQHLVRVDREFIEQPEARVSEGVRDRAIQALPKATALVVSDYDKGAICPVVLRGLLTEAERLRIPIIIDPKVRLFDHYRPATMITPNASEASEAAGVAGRTDEDFFNIGKKLIERTGCQNLLITRGERGMLLFRTGCSALVIPTVAREVFDVSGAGDTVVATLALALGAGATVAEAVLLANHAAGVVVAKVGTAAPTREELLDMCSPAHDGGRGL